MVKSSTVALAGVILAVSGGAAYWLLKKTGKAECWAIDPITGLYVKFVVWHGGNLMSIATTVPNTSVPVSVQLFVEDATGNVSSGQVHPWSIPATGYTYVINVGAAGPGIIGSYKIWTVTMFADGGQAKSDIITAIVAQ